MKSLNQVAPVVVLCSLLPLFGACDGDSSHGGQAGEPGAGSAGSGGSGGSGDSGGGGSSAGSKVTGGSSSCGEAGGEAGMADVPATPLPVPPGPEDQEAPSGTGANLRVMPWAGFGSAVSYTFDDAQPSQIEHWEELKAAGARMTFYLNTSNTSAADFDATWQEAYELGSELGNHTVNHCHSDFSGCTRHLPTLEAELDQCTAYIEANLGQPVVWTAAYPFGELGYKCPAQARFFLARGVGSGMIAPGDRTDPFNLPVYAARGGEEASVFNGRIDAASDGGKWLIFLFHSLLPTTNNWYAGVDIGSVTGSIEHAKSLETVWIDSVVNVGAYWLGQRVFEAATPETTADSTTWSWSLPRFFPRGHVLRVLVDGGQLAQDGQALDWDGHGYYEVALDSGNLTWSP
jgi:peptidoglycan/xylan/chitin deacetylase (PgdA/CDA1 family)